MVTDNNRLLGQTLGACVLERLIGRGGMGTVYLARQLRPRRLVAVKVLLPGSELNDKARADFLTRFRHEADAIAALDHINIMPIYEYGEQDQLAYLVMPYVAGGTLRQILAERHSLPLGEILPIIEQAAEALDYAHNRRIVHRDIKPGNILFHADGRLLLADFGLAKVLSETTKVMAIVSPDRQRWETIKPKSHISLSLSEGEIIGTPEYLSPEQALGQAVDGRTDIYSLGIVLYQMLVGQVPFVGATPLSIAVQHTKTIPPPIATRVPGISARVETVILRALAKEPAQRYASAGDFARAFRAAVQCEEPTRKTGGATQGKSYTLAADALFSNDTVPEMEQIVTAEPRVTGEQLPRQEGHFSAPTPPDPQKRSSQIRRIVLVVLSSLLILLLGLGSAFTLMNQKAPPRHATSVIQVRRTPPVVLPSTTSTAQKISLPALVKVGKLLYASHLLSSTCKDATGSWSDDRSVQVQCSPDATELATGQQALAGIFLKSLSHRVNIPDNYVLQVELTVASQSSGSFGIIFRSNAQGQAYTFLISPNGLWNVYTYSHASGSLDLLATGPLSGSLQGQLTLDIAVNGDTFTFSLNGETQGSAISPLYTSGALGFAVSADADIFLKNLAIYALPAS